MPVLVLNSIRPKDYDEVIDSHHPTFIELASQSYKWEVFTKAFIAAAITDYLEFVGRKTTLSDVQVAETATLIFEEYPYLKTDDLALFFRFCKLSRFGKLYDLNGAVILNWLREYLRDKNDAVFHHEQRKEVLRREREDAEWRCMSEEERLRIKETQRRIEAKIGAWFGEEEFRFGE